MKMNVGALVKNTIAFHNVYRVGIVTRSHERAAFVVWLNSPYSVCSRGTYIFEELEEIFVEEEY